MAYDPNEPLPPANVAPPDEEGEDSAPPSSGPAGDEAGWTDGELSHYGYAWDATPDRNSNILKVGAFGDNHLRPGSISLGSHTAAEAGAQAGDPLEARMPDGTTRYGFYDDRVPDFYKGHDLRRRVDFYDQAGLLPDSGKVRIRVLGRDPGKGGRAEPEVVEAAQPVSGDPQTVSPNGIPLAPVGEGNGGTVTRAPQDWQFKKPEELSESELRTAVSRTRQNLEDDRKYDAGREADWRQKAYQGYVDELNRRRAAGADPHKPSVGQPESQGNEARTYAAGSIIGELRSSGGYARVPDDQVLLEAYRKAHYPHVAWDRFSVLSQEGGEDAKKKLDAEEAQATDAELTPLKRFRKLFPNQRGSDDELIRSLYDSGRHKPGESLEDFSDRINPKPAAANWWSSVSREAAHAAADVPAAAQKQFHASEGNLWAFLPRVADWDQDAAKWLAAQPWYKPVDDAVKQAEGAVGVPTIQKAAGAVLNWFRGNAQAEQNAASQTQIPYQEGAGAAIGQAVGGAIGSTPEALASFPVGMGPKAALAAGLAYSTVTARGQAKEAGRQTDFGEALLAGGVRMAMQKVLDTPGSWYATGLANSMLGLSDRQAQDFIEGKKTPAHEATAKMIVDFTIGALNGHRDTFSAGAKEALGKAEKAAQSGDVEAAAGQVNEVMGFLPAPQRQQVAREFNAAVADVMGDPHHNPIQVAPRAKQLDPETVRLRTVETTDTLRNRYRQEQAPERPIKEKERVKSLYEEARAKVPAPAQVTVPDPESGLSTASQGAPDIFWRDPLTGKAVYTDPTRHSDFTVSRPESKGPRVGDDVQLDYEGIEARTGATNYHEQKSPEWHAEREPRNVRLPEPPRTDPFSRQAEGLKKQIREWEAQRREFREHLKATGQPEPESDPFTKEIVGLHEQIADLTKTRREVELEHPGVRFMFGIDPAVALMGLKQLSYAFEVLKPVRKAAGAAADALGLTKLEEQWKRTFSPEEVNEVTATTGAEIKGINARIENQKAQWLTMQVRKMQLSRDVLTKVEDGLKRDSFWKQFSDRTLFRFIGNHEKGISSGSPVVDGVFKVYDHIYQAMRAFDGAVGMHYDAVAFYTPHLFKSAAEHERFVQQVLRKYPDPRFVKPREFDSIWQAAKAGFKLRTLNPERLMQSRWEASLRNWGRIELLQNLEKDGLAYAKKDAQGNKATVPKDVSETWDEIRSPNGRMYYVHPDAQFMIKRAWDPTFAQNAIWQGYLQFARRVKGVSLAMPFSWSGFHAMHTSGIRASTLAATMAREAIAEGRTAGGRAGAVARGMEGLGTMGLSTVARDVRNAADLIDVAQGKKTVKDLSAADRQVWQYVNEAGLNLSASEERRLQWVDSLTRLAKGSDKAAGAAARADFFIDLGAKVATNQYWNKFLFERAIPSMKAMDFMDRARGLMTADPSLAGNRLSRIKAFSAIAKDIDRRFGEMFYDNLFWPKVLKETGIAHILSMGWDMGFFHVTGGAIKDLTHNLAHLDEVAATWRAKGAVPAARQFFTHKMLSSAFYFGLGTALNGVATKAFTGKDPEGMDWVFARIGTNPDGTPKRITNMFFNREFYSIVQHWQREGVGLGTQIWTMDRVNPGITDVYRFAINRDWQGKEIRNTREGAGRQTLQTLSYLGQQAGLPISLQGAIKDELKSPEEFALSLFGFGPAPKSASRSELENRIVRDWEREHGHSIDRAGSDEHDARKAALQAYENAIKANDAAAEAKGYQALRSLGETDAQIRKGLNASAVPLGVRLFGQLRQQSQARLLRGMTDAERAAYLPHAAKRIRLGIEAAGGRAQVAAPLGEPLPAPVGSLPGTDWRGIQ